jgi:AraC-like DNA-binding protein
MDFHKIDNVTIEAVKEAHMADKAIQDKYGVKYHQFWVNEEAGTVFCLTEGPDKETCEMVHQMAHGNIACAITQVETGFYETIMGEGLKVDHGLTKNNDNTVDLGYRSILVVSVYDNTLKKIASKKIGEFAGREIKWANDDSLISVFNYSNDAIACALEIRQTLLKENSSIPFKIGISTSQPVTADGDFFTDAIVLAHRLGSVAQENKIVISSLSAKLCKDDTLLSSSEIKSVTESDEQFIFKLLKTIHKNLSNLEFTLDMLCAEIGLSRPQLYRKITALTDKAPNDFLKDIRLERALLLLQQKSLNIAQVALEVGFDNPSYFSKCFAQKFGVTPSKLST